MFNKKLLLITLMFPLNVYAISGEKEYKISGGAGPIDAGVSSGIYYEIGAAPSITVSPFPYVQTHTIGGSVSYGLNYSCGKFDPTLGLASVLNGIKDSVKDLKNGAISAVTSAFGSLPMLLIQRNFPDIYDLLQNGIIDAKAIISLSRKTCEQMERDILANRNPYKDLVTIGKGESWKAAMGSGGYGSSGNSVVAAQQMAEEENGSRGFPWVGGHAGGEGQAPARTVADVVRAGYNASINRTPNDASPVQPDPTSGTKPHIGNVWPEPKDAEDWAVYVLGEVVIRTHDNHPVEATPGHGLSPIIEREKEVLVPQITELAYRETPPTLNELRLISSHTTIISSKIIQDLKLLDVQERALFIDQLAADVAIQRAVNKAWLIKKMLTTSLRDPNITLSPAVKWVHESVASIDSEIKDVLMQKKIKKELISNTALTLFNYAREKQDKALSEARGFRKPSEIVDDAGN